MEDLRSVRPSSLPLCCPVCGQSAAGWRVLISWVPLGSSEHCQGAVCGASLHYVQIFNLLTPFLLPFVVPYNHVFSPIGVPLFREGSWVFFGLCTSSLLSLNERTVHGGMQCFSQILFQPLAGCSSRTCEKDVVSLSVMPVSHIFPPPMGLSVLFLTSVNLVSRRHVAMLHSSFSGRNIFCFSDLLCVHFSGCP